MGLITKEVEITLNNKNNKWYKNKGYELPIIINRDGKLVVPKNSKMMINVEDLMDESNKKIEYECDCCKKPNITQWSNYKKQIKKNGKVYCHSCSISLYGAENIRVNKLKNGVTFEQWCIDNKRQDILNRWDYELNEFLPNEVSKGTTKKIWFKCPKGLHKSELKYVGEVTSDNCKMNDLKCYQCSSLCQWLLNNGHLPQLFISNKNTINLFDIGYASNKKIWIRCPNCGTEKFMTVCSFTTNWLGCPKCSDGISYPNKLAFNVLEQLGIDFINEYSPNWIKPKKYDFYFELNNNKYIVEMDGGFHNQDNRLSGQTKEESIAIDAYKDKLAYEHDIQVIRIICDKSELEYIKSNIINSILNKLFNLEKIKWNECNAFACNSLVKIACDLWNGGLNNTLDIANSLKIGRTTALIYLKRGALNGWCDYNGKDELKKKYENSKRKVYCVEFDEIFNSIKEATERLNIKSNIVNCCKGKIKSAGKHPDTGEPLHWKYI